MNSATINARKYDGTIHRSWTCEFLKQENSLLTFVGIFNKEIKHPELGVIRRGTKSFEYYWLDRWYNVFRFHEPEGELRNFYCNLNLPPTFAGGVLNYVDLDIDVLVRKNLEYEILDIEEFKENAGRFQYPDSVLKKSKETLSELERLIKSREFPFNYVNETL